jgi:hypothetical protein
MMIARLATSDYYNKGSDKALQARALTLIWRLVILVVIVAAEEVLGCCSALVPSDAVDWPSISCMVFAD